jgi:hypothetical protein
VTATGCLALLVAAVACLGPLGAEPVAAQAGRPAPWRPAGGDSIAAFANEARSMLQASTGPALTENDRLAYALVDRIARAHFARLGPTGMRGAESLYSLFDSLQLSAAISQDPKLPVFTLVQFRNPHFEGFASLAYLYWFLGNDVRSQPINLKGGRDAKLRVVWRNDPAGPYDAAILHFAGPASAMEPQLMVFRLFPTGLAWAPVQVGDDELDLGTAGAAEWTDLDRDGTAELMSWTRAETDPLFAECQGAACPPLITQRVFAHGRAGFRLIEQRSLATPYAIFVLFQRALSRGDERFAQTLVTRPEVIAKARELGWVGQTSAASFRARPAEGGVRWGDRLRFDYGEPGRYGTLVEVRFANQEGHWLLDEVLVLRQGSGVAPRSTPSATGRTR